MIGTQPMESYGNEAAYAVALEFCKQLNVDAETQEKIVNNVVIFCDGIKRANLEYIKPEIKNLKAEIISELKDQIITIEVFEGRFAEFRRDFEKLLLETKQEIRKELRDELSAFRAELREENNQWRLEMSKEFQEFKTEINKTIAEGRIQSTKELAEMKNNIYGDFTKMKEAINQDFTKMKESMQGEFAKMKTEISLEFQRAKFRSWMFFAGIVMGIPVFTKILEKALSYLN